jgi:nitrogen regulatory protein PII 2
VWRLYGDGADPVWIGVFLFGAKREMKRDGIIQPKFADKFFRLDFEAEPMPVLCLYPIPAPVALEQLRIEVCGLEEQPRLIGWQALASLPRTRLAIPLVCQLFNWSETVEWEGIRLVDLLDFLRVETHPEGYYAFYSRDGVFFETLSRDEARDPRVLLAYGLNGASLPEPHGGPLRLVVPFLQGYKSVKWLGAIRAFRHDPIGIKRLLGQSPSGHLNEEWKKRYSIVPPTGRAGDPPPLQPPSSPVNEGPATPVEPPAKVARQELIGMIQPGAAAAGRRAPEQALLREILAIVRPSKRTATRQALEAAGVIGYTTYGVLGRSRQRGLKFSSTGSSPSTEGSAIKFLPKQLFSVVVDAPRVAAAVQAIIKANRTGKGAYGDGKIVILDIDQAVRISSDERGGSAV